MNLIKLVKVILKKLRTIIEWTAILLFGWMVILAFFQLLFRWMNWGGIGWADQQLRYIVLWLAILGGILAATQDRHIKIDIVEHYVTGHKKVKLARIVNLISGFLTLIMAGISIKFLKSEYVSGSHVDNFIVKWAVPSWILELAIPIGLLAMSLFFFGNAYFASNVEKGKSG